MTINSVFSVDDFSDTFWAPTPAMNRSTSEWALEQFLEEFSAPETANPPRASVADSLTASSVASSPLASQSPSPKHQEGDDEVVEISKPLPSQLNPPSATAAVDSDEYRTFLKNQLDLACVAFALTREPSPVNPGDSANVAQSQLVAPKPSQVGLAANENGTNDVYPMVQNEVDGGPLGVPAFPSIGKKTGPPSKQTTSGSSREDSDDDDLEGDIEITDDMDPADAKRARRMLSNRESARRSRRRKQAQMNDLESQVSQLRVEHSTLLKTLTDINQKYDTAAVDNRILKADIETLRAKVKMAEERVKRATGFNPLLPSTPNVATTGLPAVNSMMGGASNAAVSMHRNPNQLFHQPVPGMANASPHGQRLDGNCLSNPKVPLVGNPQNEVAPRSNVGGSKMGEISSSIQHTGRLADLQKQIGPGVNTRVPLPAWDHEVSLAATKNKKNVP